MPMRSAVPTMAVPLAPMNFAGFVVKCGTFYCITEIATSNKDRMEWNRNGIQTMNAKYPIVYYLHSHPKKTTSPNDYQPSGSDADFKNWLASLSNDFDGAFIIFGGEVYKIGNLRSFDCNGKFEGC